jgi:hypothetical protein
LKVDNSHAKTILDALEEAGEKGLTRKEISRVVRGMVCNCENWIKTFLEAGIIEKCGKSNNADRYRLVKR